MAVRSEVEVLIFSDIHSIHTKEWVRKLLQMSPHVGISVSTGLEVDVVDLHVIASRMVRQSRLRLKHEEEQAES